jgi:cytidylate kinase
MAIISISRGSYSRGVEVAEKVAERLGYTCLARDMLLKASEEYNIPEMMLVRAIEDPPSFFRRLTKSRARYVAYIKAALLRHFLADNIVYHGLAGHFFLQGVGHALKARVIADFEERVAIVVARDGVSEQEARDTLTKSDKARRQWGLSLYGIDPEDPSLYDTVIHVGKVGTDGAADMICTMVGQGPFETTPASQRAIEDLALAASVEAFIVEMDLDKQEMVVEAKDGEVVVRLKSLPRVRGGSSYSEFSAHYLDDLRRRLHKRSLGLPGIKGLEVELAEE